MKLSRIFNRIALSAALAGTLATTSCDYLDVVPPEQVELKDAMETHDGVLGFLYSCYAFARNPDVGDLPYSNYLAEINTTADDVLNPDAWANDGQSGKILQNTISAQNVSDFWGHNYNGVGQCLMFLEELDKCDPLGRGLITAAEDKEWRAEAKALAAYYHYNILRRYGPIALLETRLPLTAPQSEFPGRYHIDYCIDWICNQLNEAAAELPAIRNVASMGRMTSTICKAIISNLRLISASPLYNGKFPYSNFKNTNWETPGYGYELISRTYDENKWRTALAAANEAISWAEGQGQRAIYTDNYYKTVGIDLNDLYIPGGASDEFKEAVLRMRYLHYAMEGEGNREAIFVLDANNLTTQWFASFPKQIMTLSSGVQLSGYSGFNPTLNAVLRFLTNDGYTPETDPDYLPKDSWYQSAGLGSEGAGRERIINLCTMREPRFYAWIGFDGGDYSMRIANGEPMVIDMLNKDKQGYKASTRDNSISGFFNQKYMPPTLQISLNNAYVGYVAPACMVIRLAEMYLNRAECYAALNMVDEAIADVNVIRRRAGAQELTRDMISPEMTIMEWVRTERANEFFAEGKRFFDIRRWVEGDKYLGLGKRTGLNAVSKENPTFEEFNTPGRLPYNYTWAPKLYLYPIQYGDVYANPQLVQNPGF